MTRILVLTQRGFAVGVVARAEGRHENLSGCGFSVGLVGEVEGHAGVINEDFLTGFVNLTLADILLGFPKSVLTRVGAVTQGDFGWIALLVFLPE